MSRIVILGDKGQNISGGHWYNSRFYSLLSECTEYDLYYPEPTLSQDFIGWKRLFAPVVKIKLLRDFKKDDIIFLGDTTYKYHILLLICCRLFTNIKTAVVIHHFQYLQFKGVKRAINYIMQKFYFSMIQDIVVPSPYTFDIARSLFRNKHIAYIPIPFQRKFTPSMNYISGAMLYVGTIDRRKGILYLVKAANELKRHNKEFHITFAGKITDIAYYDEIVEYIKQESLHTYISFVGRVSDEELSNLYKKAELFVFPSLLEGYGIVLVEALQNGLPIVAFDNSAMPYTIKNGVNGYLAQDRDHIDLTAKIELLLHNNKERQRLQHNIEDQINSLSSDADFKFAIKDFAKRMVAK